MGTEWNVATAGRPRSQAAESPAKGSGAMTVIAQCKRSKRSRSSTSRKSLGVRGSSEARKKRPCTTGSRSTGIPSTEEGPFEAVMTRTVCPARCRASANPRSCSSIPPAGGKNPLLSKAIFTWAPPSERRASVPTGSHRPSLR
ncbi:MAG: hypothetical protein QM765_19860 [Myxococcales bacterium]